MPNRQAFARSAQGGFTLIEMMVVVACLGILGVAFNTALDYLRLQDRASTFGRTAATLYDGVSAYVAKNYNSLVTGAAVPGFAAPLAPTVAELSANPNPFLPANFRATTNIGVDLGVFLSVTPAGCAPVNCNVNWHVRTLTAPKSTKDGQVDIHLAALAAEKMGRGAGWSTLANPSVIAGPGGSWSLPNPSGAQAGIILAQGSFTNSQYANFVRVNDARDPNLQGPLTVVGSISSASNISAAGSLVAGNSVVAGGLVQGAAVSATGNLSVGGQATVTGALSGQTVRPTLIAAAGAYCPQGNGAIAQEANGAILSCQNGAWTKVAGSDPATGESYSWNNLAASGFVTTNALPFYVNFNVPFAAVPTKTRLVVISSTAQWIVGESAGDTAAVTIHVNGNVCSSNGALSYGAPRVSSTCTFKIPAGSVPSVVIQHRAGGTAFLSIDAPNAPMVTYVATSY